MFKPTKSDLIRVSIALVWLYQGLWCKVLGGDGHHQAVMSTAFGASVRPALIALGLVECAIAAWVLSGRWMRQAAIVQTALLIAMNAGGLLWARQIIPDPMGMILQNFAFVMLIWIAATQEGEARHVAHA